MVLHPFSFLKRCTPTVFVTSFFVVMIAEAQIPPPQIDSISPGAGWPGGTRADGTAVPGTQIVIEGRNFHADPSQNQVTFEGPNGTRVPASVVWASPSALHYSPAGILDDSANFADPLGQYVEGFQRSEGIAVWRESVGDRFYATFPTLQTSAAAIGTLGTVKYPIGGFNWWTMLQFSAYPPHTFDRPTGIAVDDDGRIYVTNRLLHRVETYTGNLNTNSNETTWGTQGSGANQFNEPRGVDVVRLDGANFVFVADTGNNRVVRTLDDGSDFTVMAAPAGAGPIERVAVHSSGILYATDRQQGRLLRYDARTGEFLEVFADADLNHPVGVDVDSDGFVYVIDGRWVKKFDPSGEFLSRFGYTDSGDPLEQLPPEALEHPRDLAVTGDGNVLVVDSSLFEGHVSRWAPSDAQELWVRVPEGAVTGNVEVQTASGSSVFFFIVLEQSPLNVTGWSVNQGIDEYPLVADKKTAVIVELSAPANPDPASFQTDTFGSPVTDAVELVVSRAGVEVLRTSDFEVDAIRGGAITNSFMLVAEVPPAVIATPGDYRFDVSVSREGELDFSDSSTRPVTRRRSPSIGAIVLSHRRLDGSTGLGDPVLQLLFPIPRDDDVLVSWFDQTEMFRGFLNFNRYYPVPTRLSDVAYLGAMPTPGISDGVTDANASDIFDWLEGIRITLNQDGNDFEALVGLFDRQFVDPDDGVLWRGKAVFDNPVRTGLVTIGNDDFDPTNTRQDIGMVFAHEVGHINGAVPAGPRQTPMAHSIFDTVQTEHTGWDTRSWTFISSPQSIMDGADVDFNALFEGPVVDRNGVTDDGDWGHLFDVFANPHPAGGHYIEAALPGNERPFNSPTNLTIIGRVGDSSASFSYVQVGRPDTPVTPNVPSKYELVQFDAEGTVVGRWPVHLSTEQSGTSAQPRTSFRVTLPFIAQTRRIALQLNGREIGAKTVPTNPPTLTLESFEAGPSGVTLRWRGVHSQRGDLTYRLDYSTDGGSNYRVLALFDNTISERTIPYTALPGSTNARLKITASDGFHRVAVISPVFQIGNKAPKVHMLTPRDRRLLAQGVPIRAQVHVTDKEDGVLSGNSIEWFLDDRISACYGTECRIDDILISTGVGELSRVLPLGLHTLTARATDSGGLTSEASVVFSVGRDSDGDGTSDEAEEQSGTNPRDLLDAPGLLKYRSYFRWSARLEELIRQFRLINPAPEPLVTHVWLSREDGGRFPGGAFSTSGCSNTLSGAIPADGRLRIALAPQESCSIRIQLRAMDEVTRIRTRFGIDGLAADSIRMTVVDERDGRRSCWFLPRLFNLCGPRTRELRSPGRRVVINPDLEPPNFEGLLDLGPLMRAATPGAVPQNPEQRVQRQIERAQLGLDSADVLRRVQALGQVANIGAAADRLLPRLVRSTSGARSAERAAAADAIGYMGAAALPMVPRLRELLDDPNDNVVNAARASLERLLGTPE